MSALPNVKTAPVVASALSPARVRLGVAAGGLSVVLLLAACGKSEAPPAAAGGGTHGGSGKGGKEAQCWAIGKRASYTGI